MNQYGGFGGGHPGGAPATYAEPVGVAPYAGFWLRFVAFIVDLIAILVISFVVGFVLALAGLDFSDHTSNWIGFLIMVFYHAFFESSASMGSPGKMLLGIVVMNESGSRLSFGMALARNALKYVSGLILLIGFIIAAFTERKQALHDILTKSLVMRR